MSELPKWIENRRRELYSCLYHPCKECKEKEKEAANAFFEAISIAWEALEDIHCCVTIQYARGKAKDALRRIEEIGK